MHCKGEYGESSAGFERLLKALQGMFGAIGEGPLLNREAPFFSTNEMKPSTNERFSTVMSVYQRQS